MQTASIAAAFPFSIIMLFMCWSLLKGLHAEVVQQGMEMDHTSSIGHLETAATLEE